MDIDQKLFVQLKSALPAELFERNELRFLASAFRACALVVLATALAAKFIPMTLWAIPLWILYAVVNGTFGTGVWVIAHECGHGSFSKHKILNDILGYPLHTLLLVPYFSWQYSHGVHHSRTNHLDEGETHVPVRQGEQGERTHNKVRRLIGDDAFSVMNIFILTTIGWPLYLIRGVTGGPARGKTNHFVPGRNNQLFPEPWYAKIWASTLGVFAVLFGLGYLSLVYGAWRMVALYWGPYMMVNAWLVVYTYLHHTDPDTPHYDASSWNWTKGALCTIERNYPGIVNWLHFEIGSTHVVHHLFSALPHYNANAARKILEPKFGQYYRVDKRPFYESLYEAGKVCVSVKESERRGEWRYTAECSADL
eukprot:scpid72791/ scgid30169/ Omega-6 fatty acid desaturase, endoplasmic reticulum; Delta(12) desaturase